MIYTFTIRSSLHESTILQAHCQIVSQCQSVCIELSCKKNATECYWQTELQVLYELGSFNTNNQRETSQAFLRFFQHQQAKTNLSGVPPPNHILCTNLFLPHLTFGSNLPYSVTLLAGLITRCCMDWHWLYRGEFCLDSRYLLVVVGGGGEFCTKIHIFLNYSQEIGTSWVATRVLIMVCKSFVILSSTRPQPCVAVP